MIKQYLGAKKEFYKGNLHSHTTNSDGAFTPEQSVAEFSKHGYSFLCQSDHNRYVDSRKKFNTDKFIVLPGLEASAVLYDSTGTCIKVHHINGILGTEVMQKKAVKPLFRSGEVYAPFEYHGSWNGLKAAQDIIDDLHERGCIVTYNHPVWSRVEASEVLGLKNVDSMEIFNYNTVNESGTGYDVVYWDAMLRKGVRINADASDDNHNGGVFDDAFGGWITVNADSLDQDSIITAIMEGSYYSSSGPAVYSWNLEDENGKKQVTVTCSSCERINFITDGYVGSGTTVIRRAGGTLVTASYQLCGREKYIRAECIGGLNRTAWTNPIYL